MCARRSNASCIYKVTPATNGASVTGRRPHGRSASLALGWPPPTRALGHAKPVCRCEICRYMSKKHVGGRSAAKGCQLEMPLGWTGGAARRQGGEHSFPNRQKILASMLTKPMMAALWDLPHSSASIMNDACRVLAISPALPCLPARPPPSCFCDFSSFLSRFLRLFAPP